MSRGAAILLVGLVLGLLQCKSIPTTVLLHIEAATGLPLPDALHLEVFDDQGVAVPDRRVPACPDAACPAGAVHFPNSLVLYPKEDRGTLRILVIALKGPNIVGEGATPVTLRTGEQVEATVIVQPGLLPDRDHDGVPDAVDNCPDWPNPQQGPCGAGDGKRDVGTPRDHRVDRGAADRRSDSARDTSRPPDQSRPREKPAWPDIPSPKDRWPTDGYSDAVATPFGCESDRSCFGGKCCSTPWGVKLCAPSCAR